MIRKLDSFLFLSLGQNCVLFPVQIHFYSWFRYISILFVSFWFTMTHDLISGTVTPPRHDEILAPTPALSGGNDANSLTTEVESDHQKNDLHCDLKSGLKNDLHNYSDQEVRIRIYESFLKSLQCGHDPNSKTPLKEAQLVLAFFPPLLKPKIELGRTSWSRDHHISSRDNLLISKDYHSISGDDFLIRRMEENFILGLHYKFDPNEETVLSEEELVLIFFPPLDLLTDEHAQMLPARRRKLTLINKVMRSYLRVQTGVMRSHQECQFEEKLVKL